MLLLHVSAYLTLSSGRTYMFLTKNAAIILWYSGLS